MALDINDIKKLPTKMKLAIMGGVSVLILALYGFLYFKPNYDELTKKETQLAENMAKLEKATREGKGLKALKDEVKNMEETLKLAVLQLPEKKEVPSLLTTISNLGKDAGLDFKLFQPGAEKIEGFYASIPVQISVSGDYHQVAVFFDKVSKMTRIVNISDIKMSPAGTKEGAKTVKLPIQLSVSCVATTFRFVENPPPPPAPAKKEGEKKEEKK